VFSQEHGVDAQRLHAWRRRLTTPAGNKAPITFV
jgi:hypothetical protein